MSSNPGQRKPQDPGIEHPQMHRRRSELRRATRVGFNGSMEIHISTESDGSFRSVTVDLQDFSTQGIGFVYDKPLSAGQLITIRMTMSGMTTHVPGSIVNCRPVGPDQFRIGAQFCRPMAGYDNPMPSVRKIQIA